MRGLKSQKELEAALQAHQRWLESDGEDGKQADFRGANLRSMAFVRFDLTDAIFRHADLRQASLEDTSGLLPEQLAGADLTRARVPAEVSGVQFDGVKEDAGSCQRLFLAIQLACAYSVLTAATTTDALLLTNEATAPLPIINTEIAIGWFYWVAPVLLLLFHGYFHFKLQRLWERYAALPAVFPDGTPLDQISPWFLTGGIVAGYLERLRSRPRPLWRWQLCLSRIAGWGVVPFTLVVLWLRCLPRHDWKITCFQLAMLWFSFFVAAKFFRMMAATMRGVEARRWLDEGWWSKSWGGRTRYACWGLGVLFSLSISYGAICCETNLNVPGKAGREALKSDRSLFHPGIWVPILLNFFNYRTFADLDGADLSIKPQSWVEGDLSTIKGTSLVDKDLRYASGRNAFFAKADLYHADMSHAYLFGADFREAILEEAKLVEADLAGADFRSAKLGLAHFPKADLSGVDMSHAVLSAADFRQAILEEAKLVEANLRDADFRGANLGSADLTGADLDGILFDGETNLGNAILKDVENPSCELIAAASAAMAFHVPACTESPGEETMP